MKQLLIGILIVVSGAGFLHAQPDQFDKAIDYNNRAEAGMSLVISPDKSFHFFSRGFDPSDPYTLRKDVKSRLNENGEIIDQEIYFETDPFSYSIYLNNAYLSQSGQSIYTVGRKRDTISQYQGLDLFLMKLNLEGDTIWTRLYEHPDTTEVLNDCLMLPGDSMMCAGYKASNYHSNNQRYDLWVTLIDSNGNKLKELNMADTRYAHVNSIVKAFDGNGFLLCGYNASIAANSYTQIWRLDTNFNLQLEASLSNGGTNNLYRHSSGNYFVVESLASLNDFSYPDTVTLYDQNWDKLWGLRVPDSGNKQFLVDMKEWKDSSLLICGWGYPAPPIYPDPDTAISFQYAYLLKLSKEGDILWSRKYFDDIGRTGRLRGLYVDNENDWIYGWGTTLVDPHGSDAWLVRFDSLGCLEPGCDTLNDPNGMPLPFNYQEISLYPNPTSGQVVLHLPASIHRNVTAIRLFNMSGQLVRESSLKTARRQIRLDLSGLPQGMYITNIIGKEGTLATKKVVVE